LPALRAIKRTNALPTTTASANLPTRETCSGVEIPKPTASGSSVTFLTEATKGSSAPES
jgi:hypothetical protein